MISKLKFSVAVIRDLIEIDLDLYQKNHQDLLRYSQKELYEHYAKYGYNEGRICHKLSLRENFIKTSNDLKCLEIGPFVSPALTHDNVKYFDVLSTDELKIRAERIGLTTDNLPNIEFITEDGSLGGINEKFDLIFSSHNLEHQPNLISHLNEANALLNKNGVYKMIVPNCAYCFDADLSPSKISEIILAHKLKLKTHSIAKVIEHRALTVNNDSLMHWKDAAGGKREYIKIDASRIRAAIEEYEMANGSYIDVHSWQFMPHTLSDILDNLINLNLIPFKSVRCFGPVYGRNEFCLELLK